MIRALFHLMLLVLLLAGSTNFFGLGDDQCAGDHPQSIPAEFECEASGEAEEEESRGWLFAVLSGHEDDLRTQRCLLCIPRSEGLNHGDASADTVRGPPAC